MAERTVERTDSSGNVVERTVETTSSGGGSGASVLWAVVVLIAIGVAAYLFTTMNDSKARKDEAVAAAAGDVGDAAQKVGDAAKKAGEKLTQ